MHLGRNSSALSLARSSIRQNLINSEFSLVSSSALLVQGRITREFSCSAQFMMNSVRKDFFRKRFSLFIVGPNNWNNSSVSDAPEIQNQLNELSKQLVLHFEAKVRRNNVTKLQNKNTKFYNILGWHKCVFGILK